MERGNRVIYIGISLIGLLFAAGYYFGLIADNIAFPIIFFTLGFSQLYNGIFVISKDHTFARRIFIFFGGLLMIFWLIVTSRYYL